MITLRRLIYHWLPEKAAARVSARLPYPKWWLPQEDWEIFESEAMLYRDETQPPPKALRIEDFVARFEPLLECPGAGLFMLVPSSLGLAPSVDQGGESYCLGTRRHGWGPLSVTIQADNDIEHARLRVQSGSEAPSFLVEIGQIPIERLAQKQFPYASGVDWLELAYGRFEAQVWTGVGNREPVTRGKLVLTDSVDLHPGSSYLLSARTRLGTRVSAVLQCFQVVSAPKVIVAWRIINVTAAESAMPELLPWWKPVAWSSVVRSIKTDSQ